MYAGFLNVVCDHKFPFAISFNFLFSVTHTHTHSLMNEVVHTSPTIGSNVEEVKWRNIHFVMWDIGGQESLRQAWSTYYNGTSYMIMVVDSTDRERLTVTKEELYKMLSHEVSVDN